jgi:LmbE family N-acetylglucosaminyl deacetylase
MDTMTALSATRLLPQELGTILSIWAHPDDETYLAAGVMSAAREHRQRVVCATATLGEHGTDDPTTWPPERLGRVRRWEAAAAMAILGVGEHVVAGLPDGGLQPRHDAGMVWVRGLLRDVQPDTVLTFGADGMTFHPDHIAVHRWVTAAWEEHDRSFRLLYATSTTEHLTRFAELYEAWDIYMTNERPTGVHRDALSVHVDLVGDDLDRKLAALRAMATQTGAVTAALEPSVYAELVSEEAFVDARHVGVPVAAAMTSSR